MRVSGVIARAASSNDVVLVVLAAVFTSLEMFCRYLTAHPALTVEAKPILGTASGFPVFL